MLKHIPLCVVSSAAFAAAAPWLLSASNRLVTYPGVDSFLNPWIGGQVALALIALFWAFMCLWRWQNPPSIDAGFFWARARLPWWNIIWTTFLFTIACWFVGGVLLRGFPLSLDVVAYVMQAETFAAGMLTAPAPAVPEAFDLVRFKTIGDRWVSQYLPGWSLFLTPFVLVKLPLWIVPGLFAGGSLLLFWLLVRRRAGPLPAVLAVLSLCTSAFFILNASTLWAHIYCAFFGLAAAEATTRRREGGRVLWALLAGLAVGAIGFSRPFNAIIFIIVLAPAIATATAQVKMIWRLRSLVTFGLGGLPFALAVLAYQAAITGSPAETIPSELGYQEPIGTNSIHFIWTLHRAAQLILTTSPIIFVVMLISPAFLFLRRQIDFTDLLFPATVFAFLFYEYNGGVHEMYGPRYWLEAFPFLILTAAATLSLIDLSRPIARAAIAVHFSMQVAGLVGWLSFEQAVIHNWMHPLRVGENHELTNAIVVLEGRRRRYRSYYSEWHLARNGLPPFDDLPVILAGPAPNAVVRLREAFPSREIWTYNVDRRNGLNRLPDKGKVDDAH